MAGSGQSDVFGFAPTPVFVPPGATNAVLITPLAGEATSIIKYSTGGSCQIIQCPVGSTLTGPQLVSAGNSGGYPFSATEAVYIDGPARYYIMCLGTTATLYRLPGMTAGF